MTTDIKEHDNNIYKINYNQNFNLIPKEVSKVSSKKIQLSNYKSTSPEIKTLTTINNKVNNIAQHLRTKSSTSRYELKSRDKNENNNFNLNTQNEPSHRDSSHQNHFIIENNRKVIKGNDFGIIGNLNININNNYNINNLQTENRTDHGRGQGNEYLDKTPTSKKIKISGLNKNDINYIQEHLIKKLKTSHNDINTVSTKYSSSKYNYLKFRSI